MKNPDLHQVDVSGFKPVDYSEQAEPVLRFVDIDSLVIDRSYQRDITGAGRRAIQRIAENFDWSKFQPILCAPLPGGRLAIVDGQHRAHAASLVGLANVPAMIVEMSREKAALGFTAVNRDKIGIDLPAIYRAELAAGVEWAVDAERFVRLAGCVLATSNASSLSKKPGSIYCTGLIRKMVKNGEGEAVQAGLAAIRKGELRDEVRSYDGAILAIWLPALALNQRFLKLDLTEIFDGFDFDDQIDRARLKSRQTGESARSIVMADLISELRRELDERLTAGNEQRLLGAAR